MIYALVGISSRGRAAGVHELWKDFPPAWPVVVNPVKQSEEIDHVPDVE